MIRAAVLQCFYEANAFGVAPVTLRDFHASHYVIGNSLRQIPEQGGAVMAGLLAHFDAAAVQVEIGLCTSCPPGGLVDAPSWLMLRLAVLESLREIVGKGRPEILVVVLHGALAAFDVEQPEGSLLAAARQLVGDDCVIACALDFHANPSPLLVAGADVLIGGRRLPRTDGHQRGRDLAALAMRCLGQPRKTRHFPLPLVTPLQNAVSDASRDHAPFDVIEAATIGLQQRLGLDDITVLAGYPYADSAWVHSSILITGSDPAAVRQAISELAEVIWSQRDKLLQPLPEPPRQSDLGSASRATASAASQAALGLPADVRQIPYTRIPTHALPVNSVNYGDWVFHLRMLCLAVY